MTYEDKHIKLPRLKCPCCRNVIRKNRLTLDEYTIECIVCHWKSKVISGKSFIFQGDLDVMHMKEVDSVVTRQQPTQKPRQSL